MVMKRSMGLLLVIVSTVVITGCGSETRVASTSEIQQGTLIRLADGAVQGAIDGGARRFLGIPYAAPPVGDLRWRPPAPPIPWSGVRQATQFEARCAQWPQGGDLVLHKPSEEEDCLYLNVWTPAPAPTTLLP
jgi:para-nitrobenzyl esterase